MLRASRAPTSSWPWKWPSARVDGLPTSWSSAASRTTGRSAGAASTVRSVWSQRSSPGILFWGIPACAASSGTTTASSPVSCGRRRPTDGARRREQLLELGRDPLAGEMRGEPGVARGSRRGSPARSRTQGGGQPHGPDHSQRVLVESCVSGRRRPGGGAAAGRRARRRGPRASAPASIAARPHAIALTVKSRRPRSAATSTELDLMRPAVVGVLVVRRNVVTWYTSSSRRMATVPNGSRRRRREQLHQLFGKRVRREIPVRGAAPQQGVAQRAARRCSPRDRGGQVDHRPATTASGTIPASRSAAVSGSGTAPTSVPAEEQVVAPGLVPVVREVRREQ